MKKIVFLLFLVVLFTISCGSQNNKKWTVSAPAGKEITQINKQGETIIPNGRIVTPLGKTYTVAPHPYGLTLSPDGSVAVTANSGTRPFSITLLRNVTSDEPDIQQVPPGVENDNGTLAAVFMGLAITPDNKTVYVAGGQENRIFMFDVATGESKGQIECSYKDKAVDFTHGYIGDMVLSHDGSTLYAVDQINFRLLVIDTQTQKIKYNVPTGRYPFGITLSPDGKHAWVANVGMFEYKYISSVDPKNMQGTALHYPPFAYNTKEARDGIDTDSVKVPGLGDPNVPESFSVWKVDLEQTPPKVTAKVKTGILVGEMVEDFPAVGGASPNSVVATERYIFVSNGNNDCISVIDTQQDTVVQNISLSVDKRLGQLRGVIPFGLALSPDNKRLYVAESGINAVGVLDIEKMKVLGHIPAGWFPSKIRVSKDGKKLIVANAKGFGSGPNGGPAFDPGPEGSNIGRLMKGTVTIMDIPADGELKSLTQKVVENNFNFEQVTEKAVQNRGDNPIPLFPGQKESPIKHIVFVSKENRTYDEVFGQVENGNGEPSLARYGAGVNFKSDDKKRSVENATVMRNHLELAKRFAISDNFYCDSDHSADGHRWLVNTYPNEWVETSVSASYGGGRRMRQGSAAPGNLAFVGATGAIYPEDYNEAGSIWDHLERNKIDFFNFGFGLELAPSYGENVFKYTGVRYVVNYPVPAPIYDKSSKIYATYNTGIPDQFRIDMFLKEFNDRWMGEGKTMPSVITIMVPNDHGSGERPKDGYPFRESYMVDNDLAVGRMIEFLSHTPYWKNMAIVITEDDSQGGVDHIDAHRSLLMVISPWVKKNYVSHVHYSFGSIFKTFWHILGLPYLNQYDAGASDMSDFFTNEPDFNPYNALAPDMRIFDPQKALDPFDENFNWKAVADSPILDHPADMLENSIKEDKIRAEKNK